MISTKGRFGRTWFHCHCFQHSKARHNQTKFQTAYTLFYLWRSFLRISYESYEVSYHESLSASFPPNFPMNLPVWISRWILFSGFALFEPPHYLLFFTFECKRSRRSSLFAFLPPSPNLILANNIYWIWVRCLCNGDHPGRPSGFRSLVSILGSHSWLAFLVPVLGSASEVPTVGSPS